jgi:nickel-type superoxide dismutase maturation protease
MLVIRYVEGMSMAPALRPGMLVVALRQVRRLRIGDIVIVRHEGLDKIKRVTDLDAYKLFVEGDNKPYSTDSRHFGWVARNNLRGKVIWPRN